MKSFLEGKSPTLRKGNLRVLSYFSVINCQIHVFLFIFKKQQRHIWDPVKHLWWSFSVKIIFAEKHWSSHRRRSIKNVFLKICKIHMKTPVQESPFYACNLLKKRLLHRCFFCKFWEIFKNTFFKSLLANKFPEVYCVQGWI